MSRIELINAHRKGQETLLFVTLDTILCRYTVFVKKVLGIREVGEGDTRDM
jgi:hypothetical protein